VRMTWQLVCRKAGGLLPGVSGVAPLCEKLTGRGLPDVYADLSITGILTVMMSAWSDR